MRYILVAIVLCAACLARAEEPPPVQARMADELRAVAEQVDLQGEAQRAVELRAQAARLDDLRRWTECQVELRRLQAETAELRKKLGIGDRQIAIKVRMIEFKRTEANCQKFDLGELSVMDRYVGSHIGAGDVQVPFKEFEPGHPFLKQVDAWLADPDGPARLLADPRLVSLDGGSAFIHAGGEFPVVGSTNALGETKIEYRRYGMQLDVRPKLLDDGRVQVSFRPRASELDPGTSIKVMGVEMPGLTIRELDMTYPCDTTKVLAIGGIRQTRTVTTPRKMLKPAQSYAYETELLVLTTVEVLPEGDASPKSPTSSAPLIAAPPQVQPVR